MRILFIVEHFPAISETFVLNQVTGLIDRGHDVEVYALGKPVAPVVHPDFTEYDLQARTWEGPNIPPGWIRRLFCAARELPGCLARFPLATLRALNVFRHGRQAANLCLLYSLFPFLNYRRDFDVICCHFGDKGILAQLWKDWGVICGGLAVVFHAHEMAGLSDAQGRKLYGALFESDALLLPETKYWRDCLLRWGAKPERTLVHRMGVDCERFCYQPKPINANEPIQLLSVCRLTEMKGTEYAIRAVAKLRPKYPGLHYTVAGGGPLHDHLTGLITQLGVDDIVTLAGPQPQDKVAALLREAHIYLVPSVTDAIGCKEGLPVALMEALAAGVPAIGTRHAGIPELITDHVTGLLVEERDVDGLARAIESLITDPQFCSKLVTKGRAVVEQEFNIRQLNERLEYLFRAEPAA